MLTKKNCFITLLNLYLVISSFAKDTGDGYKVLFSNDFTNIETCTSPYHKKGQSWTPEMLKATVDETAGTGIDVHMLQPAHGWVPWWPSEVYSMQEHYQWWHSKYGNYPVTPVHEYILKGGDPFIDFISRCRQHGISPFISLRMNDGHHLENVNKPDNRRGPHAICKFYAEHPEYRIGQDIKSWDEHVQNWAIKEVRDYKFAFIEEICKKYDIDGFEMDFMRHPSLFRVDETTFEQRSSIMTGFIRRVRKLLNETAQPGSYRSLCVRIPVFISMYDKLGIDLKAWTQAGVDMINASPTYFTIHMTDLPEITKTVPETKVYLEMCHTTMIGKSVAKGYDAFTFKRTTKQQYYTAAHLAYSRGAAGVSAFNFVYYREHGKGERGPFNEPPFEIFKHLDDPRWLANQPQHYILTKAFETPNMPQNLTAGGKAVMKLDMAPPAGGWSGEGKMRIQTPEPIGKAHIEAKINGVGLIGENDISEPYKTPYKPLSLTSERARAWKVPAAVLKNGINVIELKMTQGRPIKIDYLDMAIQ